MKKKLKIGHVQRRMAARFDMDFTMSDHNKLVGQITSGNAVLVENRNDVMELYRVTYSGVSFVAAFNRITQRIVTVLFDIEQHRDSPQYIAGRMAALSYVQYLNPNTPETLEYWQYHNGYNSASTSTHNNMS